MRNMLASLLFAFCLVAAPASAQWIITPGGGGGLTAPLNLSTPGNTTGFLPESVNPRTASYSVLSSDGGNLVTMSGSGLTLTLPSPVSLGAGFTSSALVLGSNPVTLSGNINGGATTYTLNPGDAALPVNTGATYDTTIICGSLANITATDLLIGGGANTCPIAATGLVNNSSGVISSSLYNAPAFVANGVGSGTGIGSYGGAFAAFSQGILVLQITSTGLFELQGSAPELLIGNNGLIDVGATTADVLTISTTSPLLGITLAAASGGAIKFTVGGSLPTGTASTYACFTSSGALISSTTAC